MDMQPTNQQCPSIVGVGMASMSSVCRCNWTWPSVCHFEHPQREQYCHSQVSPGREVFVLHVLATSSQKSGFSNASGKDTDVEELNI